jgi:hypothetical protein
MLRAALGMEPDAGGGGIKITPHLPAFIHYLKLSSVLAFGHQYDIEVVEGRGTVVPSSKAPLLPHPQALDGRPAPWRDRP